MDFAAHFNKLNVDQKRQQDLEHWQAHEKTILHRRSSIAQQPGGVHQQHMTTSDFAKARRSIREAILHLAHRLTRHNNDSSDGATEHIHDLWKSHFLTYSERGEHGISIHLQS